MSNEQLAISNEQLAMSNDSQTRQMKDSGVEWIGEIPESWEIRKIKDCYKLQAGFTPDTKNESYYDDNGYDWVNISDIEDGKTIISTKKKISHKYVTEFSPAIIPMGSLLYSFKLSVGQTAFTGKEMYSNEAIAAFLPTEAICLAFLRYSSFLIVENAETNIYGAKILNRERIKNALVVNPPLEEQQTIASYLDRKCAQIDTLIANQQQQIEKLKAYKQSVITETVTKGLDPDVPMKDSGVEWIGEIPEIWSIRKLRSFANIISKGTTPKNMSQNFDDIFSIRYLKSENIVDNHLSYYPNFYIEKSVHEGELSRSILSKNDLLFVIAGASIGKVAIMDEKLLPANTNQAVSFIRINEKYKNIISFIWYYLQSDLMKRYIQLFAVQSAQPNISMENLGYFPVVFTEDRKMIGEIVDYLDQKCEQIDRLIAIKQQKIEKIQQYKKSIIYEYVTGKREVST